MSVRESPFRRQLVSKCANICSVSFKLQMESSFSIKSEMKTVE